MADSIAMTDAEIISAPFIRALVRLSEDVLLLGETYEAMVAGIVAHHRAPRQHDRGPGARSVQYEPSMRSC